MKVTTLNSLRDKEVISVNDGVRLGCVIDVEIDLKCGQVLSIIIPPPGKIFNFFPSKDNCKIPWDCIEKIGNDIILVKTFNLICDKKEAARKL